MDNNQNDFRNISNFYENNQKNTSFKSHVFVPFISGALGSLLVIGTCFGVPEIKQKLVGTNYIKTSFSTQSLNNTGTVDFVSLNNYSDTAVFSANKILPSIVGIEVTYNVKSNMSSFYYSIFGNIPNGQDSTSTATASGSRNSYK